MKKQQSKQYVKTWKVSIWIEGNEQSQPELNRCNTFCSMTEASDTKHEAQAAACAWQQALLN